MSKSRRPTPKRPSPDRGGSRKSKVEGRKSAGEKTITSLPEIRRVIPKKTWCEWSGRQHKILDEQAERYGIPLAGETIDLAAVAVWIHDLFATKGRRILAGDSASDVANDETTSPALERKREVEYQLRLRDLAERDGQLVSRDKMRQGVAAIAGVLRQCGDTLNKQFGEDALDVLNDALADAERASEALFELREEGRGMKDEGGDATE